MSSETGPLGTPFIKLEGSSVQESSVRAGKFHVLMPRSVQGNVVHYKYTGSGSGNAPRASGHGADSSFSRGLPPRCTSETQYDLARSNVRHGESENFPNNITAGIAPGHGGLLQPYRRGVITDERVNCDPFAPNVIGAGNGIEMHQGSLPPRRNDLARDLDEADDTHELTDSDSDTHPENFSAVNDHCYEPLLETEPLESQQDYRFAAVTPKGRVHFDPVALHEVYTPRDTPRGTKTAAIKKSVRWLDQWASERVACASSGRLHVESDRHHEDDWWLLDYDIGFCGGRPMKPPGVRGAGISRSTKMRRTAHGVTKSDHANLQRDNSVLNLVTPLRAVVEDLPRFDALPTEPNLPDTDDDVTKTVDPTARETAVTKTAKKKKRRKVCPSVSGTKFICGRKRVKRPQKAVHSDEQLIFFQPPLDDDENEITDEEPRRGVSLAAASSVLDLQETRINLDATHDHLFAMTMESEANDHPEPHLGAFHRRLVSIVEDVPAELNYDRQQAQDTHGSLVAPLAAKTNRKKRRKECSALKGTKFFCGRKKIKRSKKVAQIGERTVSWPPLDRIEVESSDEATDEELPVEWPRMTAFSAVDAPFQATVIASDEIGQFSVGEMAVVAPFATEMNVAHHSELGSQKPPALRVPKFRKGANYCVLNSHFGQRKKFNLKKPNASREQLMMYHHPGNQRNLGLDTDHIDSVSASESTDADSEEIEAQDLSLRAQSDYYSHSLHDTTEDLQGASLANEAALSEVQSSAALVTVKHTVVLAAPKPYRRSQCNRTWVKSPHFGRRRTQKPRRWTQQPQDDSDSDIYSFDTDEDEESSPLHTGSNGGNGLATLDVANPIGIHAPVAHIADLALFSESSSHRNPNTCFIDTSAVFHYDAAARSTVMVSRGPQHQSAHPKTLELTSVLVHDLVDCVTVFKPAPLGCHQMLSHVDYYIQCGLLYAIDHWWRSPFREPEGSMWAQPKPSFTISALEDVLRCLPTTAEELSTIPSCAHLLGFPVLTLTSTSRELVEGQLEDYSAQQFAEEISRNQYSDTNVKSYGDQLVDVITAYLSQRSCSRVPVDQRTAMVTSLPAVTTVPDMWSSHELKPELLQYYSITDSDGEESRRYYTISGEDEASKLWLQDRIDRLKEKQLSLPLSYPDFLSVIELAYYRMDPAKGRAGVENRKAIRGAISVYGENQAMYGGVSEDFVEAQIVERMRIGKETKFLDIGSGIGQICIQVAATVACQSYGIEIIKDRHDCAMKLVEMFDLILREINCDGRIRGLVHLTNGDFVDEDNNCLVSEADVIFFNNFGPWFRPHDPTKGKNYPLLFSQQIMSMKVGSRILCLEDLVEAKHWLFAYPSCYGKGYDCSWSSKPLKLHFYHVGSKKWVCAHCTHENELDNNLCVKCYTRDRKGAKRVHRIAGTCMR